MEYPSYFKSKQGNYAACILDEFTAVVVVLNNHSSSVRKTRPYNNSDIKAIVDTNPKCTQLEFLEVYEKVTDRQREIINEAIYTKS